MTGSEPHPLRCETCHKRETLQCPIQNEGAYYKVKEYVTVPTGWEILTSIIGCASHSSASEPVRLCDDCNIIELEEKVMHLEQDLKDVHKAARKYVLDGFDW